MPKGRRKGRGHQGHAENGVGAGFPVGSDEDYDTGDSGSIISSYSDVPGADGDAVNGSAEVDEVSAQENFEEKLKDCIDGITQKSMKARHECLEAFKCALSKKFIPDFVEDRKLTIYDCLEKSLKKGKGEEQSLAAAALVLEVIQLGMGSDSEQLYTQLRPTMANIMLDATAAPKARSACAVSLAQLTFLASGGIEQVVDVMELLESVFRASYLKGNKVAPVHSPEITALHTNALTGWALLMTIAPNNMIQKVCYSHLNKLPELLESSDVDLRIAAGDTIALMYELVREHDEDFEGDDIDGLCDKLKQLATDSNKYRAKKDRRQQRFSFREILRTVQQGDSPACSVQFGNESLEIYSWARKRQYDTLCQVLGPGINVHLRENDLVRDIFELGSPIPVGTPPVAKATKFERQMYNAAVFKARTKARAKYRDKRSRVVDMSDS